RSGTQLNGTVRCDYPICVVQYTNLATWMELALDDDDMD
ncbi:hypothetical protein ISN44_As09g003830, partial [Arabidopsis suecica]